MKKRKQGKVKIEDLEGRGMETELDSLLEEGESVDRTWKSKKKKASSKGKRKPKDLRPEEISEDEKEDIEVMERGCKSEVATKSGGCSSSNEGYSGVRVVVGRNCRQCFCSRLDGSSGVSVADGVGK